MKLGGVDISVSGGLSVGANHQVDGSSWSSSSGSIDMTWQKAGGTLEIRRSPFSEEPLFYRIDGTRLSISDRPDALGSQADKQVFDVVWLADYLAFQSSLSQRTHLKAVQQLRRGETVEFKPGQAVTSNFGPFAFQSGASGKDITRKLRAEVEKVDLRDTVFHISAGLDSSLLALLARAGQPKDSVQVATFRTRGKGASDEISVVERLATDFGFDLRIFDFREIDLFAAGDELVRALGMPLAHPSSVARYLLDKELAAEGCRQIVTGRGADEVLAGYPWHLPDCIGPLHAARVRSTPADLVRALIPGVVESAAQRYDAFFARNGYDLVTRQLYDLASLGNDWAYIEVELSKALGIGYLSPFSNPEIQAAAAALPTEMKIDERSQKVLLRQAFADLYPDYILNQPKRGLAMDVVAYFRDYSFDDLLARILSASETVAARLDRATLFSMLDDSLMGRQNFGWQLWSLYLASRAASLVTGTARDTPETPGDLV